MSTFGDINTSQQSSDKDYYIILGVDFKATQDTIVYAYRQLARKYHPDKHHQNETKRKEAEIIFNRIKEAYDVLGNPHKRAIYDTVGPEGLKLEGWKIVPKLVTAQDIREEYERLVKNKQESQMLNIAKPRGVFTVSIDASDIFAKRSHHHHSDYDDEDDEDDDFDDNWPSIEISSMSAAMSVEHTIETKHAIRLHGSVDTKNGTGGGSIGTRYRHTFSPTGYVELVYQIGQGPIFTVRGQRKLTSKTSLMGSWSLHRTSRNYFRPVFTATLDHNFKDNVIGRLSYKEGVAPSLTTSLIYMNARLSSDIATSLKLGVDQSTMSLDLGYHPKTSDTKFSLSLGLASEDGLEVEYGVQTVLSDISIMGAVLAFSMPAGVTLKIRYNRANQEFNFPIYLADEITAAPIFYGTVIPIVSYQLFRQYYPKKAKNANDE